MEGGAHLLLSIVAKTTETGFGNHIFAILASPKRDFLVFAALVERHATNGQKMRCPCSFTE